MSIKKISSLIDNSSIEKINLKRVYPNTLIFNVEKRVPFLNVSFENCEYFADINGILFKYEKSYKFNKKILKIDKIEKFNEAFNFSKRCFLNYEISHIEFIYLKALIVITINNFKIFIKEKNKEELFDTAINIYKKLREKNIKFKEIDLSYGYNHIVIR